MIIEINVTDAKNKLEELAAFMGWRVKHEQNNYAILDEFGSTVVRTKDPNHFEFDAVELMGRKFNNIRNQAASLMNVVLAGILAEAENREFRDKRFRKMGKYDYVKFKLNLLIGGKKK